MVVVRPRAKGPASAWCAMALVAKESILVIILRGQILEFCGTLRLGGSDVGLCWPSADLVGRVIVADAEIHGQLSAVPRYLPPRKDLLTSRLEAAICYPQAVPKAVSNGSHRTLSSSGLLPETCW